MTDDYPDVVVDFDEGLMTIDFQDGRHYVYDLQSELGTYEHLVSGTGSGVNIEYRHGYEVYSQEEIEEILR